MIVGVGTLSLTLCSTLLASHCPWSSLGLGAAHPRHSPDCTVCKKGLSENHCPVQRPIVYRIRFELTGRVPVLCCGSSAVVIQSLLGYAPRRSVISRVCNRPCCTLLTEWNNVSFTLQRKSVYCGSSYPLHAYLALADVIGELAENKSF